MKRKKCKRCGKVKVGPYHTCAATKPDPIRLGEELAEYIVHQWTASSPLVVDEAARNVIELGWERDFWRGKCLGE